ncbi:hypothetical protein ACSVH2_00655 [Flavobacterium sp. RSB2_4_14]|uniref:hypothetical protein n=1 Tax=Flavobacterium sp. RSB2_4_14 TaxID=3447665 RepID=UPI003F3ECC7D
MKNKSLGILILSLLGYFLIVLSIFFLYQGINSTREEVTETKKELEKAKKKIEKLSNELVEKKASPTKALSTVFPKSDQFAAMLGNNVPLIEITDLDLSNNNRKSKKSGKLLTYQFRFYIFNVGKNSLKDVIVSVKDIYNDPRKIEMKSRTIGNVEDESVAVNNLEIGTFENFNINTLNLKSRRLVYASTMTTAYGEDGYIFNVIVEWKCGFYQFQVKINKVNGKLNYFYEYFDINGKSIDFDKLKNGILK